MAVKHQVNKLKKQVKQLRKTYADAVASANKVVAKGLEKLADQELKAVRKHYEAAINDLKGATKKGNVRDVAQAQAKVLQDTLDRVVKTARDSVGIISDTSKELTKILKKAAQSTSNVASGKAPAKKAAKKKPAAKKKSPAKKAAARKPAARKTASARKRSSGGAKPATRKRATARKTAG